ncbi:NSY1-like protein [Mya arenaria]|uniref:NSY1-like protein n=1 Tax=Mya arenaria TaxID=6604 RepID=A0ABY7EHU1_MYAAR|nr:NSY1-like protein [Mya arenaria]
MDAGTSGVPSTNSGKSASGVLLKQLLEVQKSYNELLKKTITDKKMQIEIIHELSPSMVPPTSPPFSHMVGAPSVVINEPPDEALINWLRHCRLDPTSIEKIVSEQYTLEDLLDLVTYDQLLATNIKRYGLPVMESHPDPPYTGHEKKEIAVCDSSMPNQGNNFTLNSQNRALLHWLQTATTLSAIMLQTATGLSAILLQSATGLSAIVLQTATDLTDVVLQTASDLSATMLQTATDLTDVVLLTATDLSAVMLQTATDLTDVVLQTASVMSAIMLQTATDLTDVVLQTASELSAIELQTATCPSAKVLQTD